MLCFKVCCTHMSHAIRFSSQSSHQLGVNSYSVWLSISEQRIHNPTIELIKNVAVAVKNYDGRTVKVACILKVDRCQSELPLLRYLNGHLLRDMNSSKTCIDNNKAIRKPHIFIALKNYYQNRQEQHVQSINGLTWTHDSIEMYDSVTVDGKLLSK